MFAKIFCLAFDKIMVQHHYVLKTVAGSLFPEEFFTFLRVFMVRFASVPVLTPDEKVVRYYIACMECFESWCIASCLLM